MELRSLAKNWVCLSLWGESGGFIKSLSIVGDKTPALAGINRAAHMTSDLEGVIVSGMAGSRGFSAFSLGSAWLCCLYCQTASTFTKSDFEPLDLQIFNQQIQ